TDEIPVYYRTQVLWYLDVLGLERADVCALIGGCDYREYSVTYDADEAALLREGCRQFLDEVAAGIRPDIDTHGATYQVIRELHPLIDEADVDLPGDIAEQYIAARCELAAATETEQLARSVIADLMGNAKR